MSCSGLRTISLARADVQSLLNNREHQSLSPPSISSINTKDAATITPKVRPPGDSKPLPVEGWTLLRSRDHPLLSKNWQNFPDASVLHFRDSERFVSTLFPATFLPLSGFSAFPSLLSRLTAILGITMVAEQKASHPAATSAGHPVLGSRNLKNLNAVWVQARGTQWQLCITHSPLPQMGS